MISQSTPYTSFPSFGEYLYKEYPVPVSRLAHLLSDDLELYQGPNKQLKSIVNNRLNFFDEEKNVVLGSAFLPRSTETAKSKPAADDDAKQKSLKKKARKKAIIIVAIVIVVVVVLTLFKLKKS